MNKEKHFVWAPECVIKAEKIVCIYTTSDGFYKIVAVKDEDNLKERVFELKRGCYMTFRIKQKEYLNIHRYMLNLWIQSGRLEESIERMSEYARGTETGDRRILESLIFTDGIHTPERESDFLDRVSKELE